MPIHHHADNPSPSPKPNSIFVSLLLKPIIMLFIFSLFLFLGIAAVSLLLLLLAGSSLHLCRRHPRRSTATATVEELRKYLPPRLNYDGRVESVRECAVCLECLKEGEWCRRLPDCNHVFHLSCVDSWLTKVLNCPICRAPVYFHFCGSGPFVGEIDDFKLGRGRRAIGV